MGTNWVKQPKRDKYGKVIVVEEEVEDGEPVLPVPTRLETWLEEKKETGKIPRTKKSSERERKELKRHQAEQYVEWLLASVEPESLPGIIQEATEFARHHKSYKGMLEVAKFIIEYSVGSPLKRTEMTFGANPQDWADAFADPETKEVFGEDEVTEEEANWLNDMLEMRRRQALVQKDSLEKKKGELNGVTAEHGVEILPS